MTAEVIAQRLNVSGVIIDTKVSEYLHPNNSYAELTPETVHYKPPHDIIRGSFEDRVRVYRESLSIPQGIVIVVTHESFICELLGCDYPKQLQYYIILNTKLIKSFAVIDLSENTYRITNELSVRERYVVEVSGELLKLYNWVRSKTSSIRWHFSKRNSDVILSIPILPYESGLDSKSYNSTEFISNNDCLLVISFNSMRLNLHPNISLGGKLDRNTITYNVSILRYTIPKIKFAVLISNDDIWKHVVQILLISGLSRDTANHIGYFYWLM